MRANTDKRGRPKNRRAGCLFCKSQKANGANDETHIGNHGFGKIRKLIAAKQDQREAIQQEST